MATANITAEFFQNIGYLAEDEGYFKKVQRYIKKLVSQKETEEMAADGCGPRAHDELVADFREALNEVRLGLEGKAKARPAEELLNEL